MDKNFWSRTYKWDFTNALGDTIMEKYESLYVSIFDVAKHCGELKYLICSKELCSIFETATRGFEPDVTLSIVWSKDVQPPERDFYKVGRMNNKFDLYIDAKIPKNSMFVCGTEGTHKIEVNGLF
jgi:hypothetical protein